MTSAVNPIPQGYHSIIPYLTIKDAARAIEFYKRAFGAEETVRIDMPDGTIAHAELKIGDSILMLAEEMEGEGCGKSPGALGGSPVMLHFYTEGVDEIVEQAVEAGAILKKPVKDQFYGDRTGAVTDPFGHEWYIATHIEDMSQDEMRQRTAAFVKEQSEGQGA